MSRYKSIERYKVSVLFPMDLLKKVRMLASVRGESLSQVIIRLTERGLREEFGDGAVNVEVMKRLAGNISAGGDAFKDSEDLYL